MAGFKSDYLSNAILNWLFNGAALPTIPGTIYCALFSTAVTSAGGGTEITGGGYARVGVARNTTNFPTTTNKLINNATVIQFPTATANYPAAVIWAAWFDAATGGNLLDAGPLGASVTVTSGQVFAFLANAFAGTEA